MATPSPLELVVESSLKTSEKKILNPTRCLMLGVLDASGMEGSWEMRDSKRIRKKGRERFGAIRIESRGGAKSIRVWCKPRGNDTAFEYSLLPPAGEDIQMVFAVLKRVNPVSLKLSESSILPATVLGVAMGMPPLPTPRAEVVEIADEEPGPPDASFTASEAADSLLPEAISRIKAMLARYEEATRHISEIDRVLAPLDGEIEAMRLELGVLSEREEETRRRISEMQTELKGLKLKRGEVSRKLSEKEKERGGWEEMRTPHAAERERIAPILSLIGVKK